MSQNLDLILLKAEEIKGFTNDCLIYFDDILQDVNTKLSMPDADFDIYNSLNFLLNSLQDNFEDMHFDISSKLAIFEDKIKLFVEDIENTSQIKIANSLLQNLSFCEIFNENQKCQAYIEQLSSFMREIKSDTDKSGFNMDEVSKLKICEGFERITQCYKGYILEVEKCCTVFIDSINADIDKGFDTLSIDDDKVSSDNSEKLRDLKAFIIEKSNLYRNQGITGEDLLFEIKGYFEALKNLFDKSDIKISTRMSKKLKKLEKTIATYEPISVTLLDSVVDKLENLKVLSNECYEDTNQELKLVKDALVKLCKEIKYSDSEDNINSNIINFLSSKFEEISKDIDDLSEDVSMKFQSGFSGNAELIEEKIGELINLVKEFKCNLSSDSEIFKKMVLSDDKLFDIKQELEFVGTDIKDLINQSSNELLSEVSQMKEFLTTLKLKTETDDNNMLESLSAVHNTICELTDSEMKNLPEVSSLNDSYSRLVEMVENSSNSLREFFISDMDSVIIKLDNIKAELEEKIEQITLPDMSKISDLAVFKTQIEEFKKSENELLDKAVVEVHNLIKEDMLTQSDDLKSWVTLSLNNNAIIAAIDELKDSIASIDVSSNPFEISTCFDEFSDKLKKMEVSSDKVDIIMSKLSQLELIDINLSATTTLTEEIDEALEALKLDIEGLKDTLDGISNSNIMNIEVSTVLKNFENYFTKIDLLPTVLEIDDIKKSLSDIKNTIETKDYDLNQQLSSMLGVLNTKIDIIAESNDDTDKDSLDEIKELIYSQIEAINEIKQNDKSQLIKKYLEEFSSGIDSIEGKDSSDVKKALLEMKESLTSIIVSVFDQVSFIEESEDIKDFVEEKTYLINENLLQVTNQLKQLTSSNEEDAYSYTMQDIESDLARMRIVLNNLQTEKNNEEVSSIVGKISKLDEAVNSLKQSLTEEQMLEMKLCFDEITNDLKKLNDLTSDFITSTDEYNVNLNNNLLAKVDRITKMIEVAGESNKVTRKALIYMGEWIDTSSDEIRKISKNSEDISEIKTSLDELKAIVPSQAEIISLLEERFETQQRRIDRLEMTLDKLLTAVEDIDDSRVTRKIDKIDKQLSLMSESIEKLTAYVE